MAEMRVRVTGTGKPTIVLANPAKFGVPPDHLIGADEEYLRRGGATATIIDSQGG